MCNVMALTLASAIVGGVGQMQAASAQAAAANYQAQVNLTNATLAENRARDALMRGAEEEQRVRQEGGQLQGRQVAQMAAAGLDLTFGSPLDILTDTAVGIEMDALRTRRNAAVEAEDYDRQAWGYRAQAGLDQAEARNARAAGRIGAVGSILSGANSYYRYRASIA